MSNFVHKSSPVEETQSSNLSSLFNKRNKDAQANQDNGSFKLEDEVVNKKSIKLPFIKIRLPLQVVLGLVVLLLLVVGAASAMFLTTLNQDVRQQASGCTYWNGGAAVEGAIDNRGGITQKCVNGYWSALSTGTEITDTGASGSSSACGSGEIFCGGCINDCRPATDTCNTQIDNECKQTGCGGNGVFPEAGEQCCSGLQQCANGRCAPSCSLDSNPVCGGIREGSNCNNGGKWTCDSTVDGGSGHCEGGVWNQPTETESTRVSCDLNGNIIYTATKEACASAQQVVIAAQAFLGGTSDITTNIVEQISSTVSSTRTDTHNQRCNLGGTIVYVTTGSVCSQFGGTSVATAGRGCQSGEAIQCINGIKLECMNEEWVNQGGCGTSITAIAGGGCISGEAVQCVGGAKFECMNEEWISQGSCGVEVLAIAGGGCIPGEAVQCVGGKQLECMNEEWISQGSCGTEIVAVIGGGCRSGEAIQCINGIKLECMNEEWVGQGNCQATSGESCDTNYDTQCAEGILYECMNEEWVSQYGCGVDGPGAFVNKTCYYLGVDNFCTPSTKYLRSNENCDSVVGNFTDIDNCDDLRSEAGIIDPKISCWTKTSINCMFRLVKVRPGEDCSTPYFNDSNCGVENSEVSGDDAPIYDVEFVEKSPQVEGELDPNYFIWTEPETWGWNVFNLSVWRWNSPEVEETSF